MTLFPRSKTRALISKRVISVVAKLNSMGIPVMSRAKGVEAYTLIVAEHGADEQVLSDLRKLEGIAEASLVYGEYDVHCKIKVDDMQQLKHVIEKIRKLKIITSETFIAYEKFSKRAKLVRNSHIRRLGHARTRR